MTAATTVETPIMERLRAETRGQHDATEAIPFSKAMLDGDLPLERYVGQLRGLRVIHETLEKALVRSEHEAVKAVWQDHRAKSPLLAADVDYFSDQPIDPAIGTAAMTQAESFAQQIAHDAEQDPVRLLGYFYVLEGSTLGGTILRKSIAKAYGLQEDGLAYYTAYGNDVMPNWKQFKDRMNSAVTDPAQQDRVIAAASDAFRHIGNVLRALSQDL